MLASYTVPSDWEYVEIVWKDAHDFQASQWMEQSEAVSSDAVGVIVVTVGRLLQTSMGYHTVCTTTTEEGQVRGVFNIPESGVVSFKYLK